MDPDSVSQSTNQPRKTKWKAFRRNHLYVCPDSNLYYCSLCEQSGDDGDSFYLMHAHDPEKLSGKLYPWVDDEGISSSENLSAV